MFSKSFGSGGLMVLWLIYPAQAWRMRHLEALRTTFHEGGLSLYLSQT